MAYRLFHLNLISAENLKDVNLFKKMAVYASASVSNDPGLKQTTFVDKDGGKRPTWNFPMTFCIPTANPDGLVLHIQLKSRRTLRDSDVGEVRIPIPIKELLLLEGTAKSVSCPVINPSGNPEGILNISYHVVEVAPPQPPQPPGTAYAAAVAGSNAYPPAEAYHYPPPAGPYPYRPPQPAYGYGVPQPQLQPGYGYGYPPQAQPGYGYGYPPQAAATKPEKNLFGIVLSVGMLAANLGGALIGDDF